MIFVILEENKRWGKSISKGKKESPDVSTFYIDERFIDKVPLKADKPDSYVRNFGRLVDGLKFINPSLLVNIHIRSYLAELIVLLLKCQMAHTIKLITKKQNNHIKPFLLECSSFANNYKGDFS